MTWTRWAVTVESSDPMATYATLWHNLKSSGRFCVRAFGVTDKEVRVVVEYTACGANSDDVKRKFVAAGVERQAISTVKIASYDTDYTFNGDIRSAVATKDGSEEVKS
jgi:hypothetical protein